MSHILKIKQTNKQTNDCWSIVISISDSITDRKNWVIISNVGVISVENIIGKEINLGEVIPHFG